MASYDCDDCKIENRKILCVRCESPNIIVNNFSKVCSFNIVSSFCQRDLLIISRKFFQGKRKIQQHYHQIINFVKENPLCTAGHILNSFQIHSNGKFQRDLLRLACCRGHLKCNMFSPSGSTYTIGDGKRCEYLVDETKGKYFKFTCIFKRVWDEYIVCKDSKRIILGRTKKEVDK